ncbi:cation-translocating P-type ATPase [Jeotgalibaca ciconiae]|uniref:P-type Ca(2+) transporter n=1 Tax=Jeotgalibaca ciconiae TaxID=2496265 RepID=A0A3Q9BIT5_9LACT|nr:cation-translocating P-type ATPase [Jeotgalibaca ciconiae]AZP03314.1 cation-translocating P-type ATPase [Jeotgalibaca ciconiae]
MVSKNQIQEAFYNQDPQAVLSKLDVTKDGLSDAEAKKRIDEYGHNALDEGESRGLVAKFFDQFKDFMIIVLLAAALISGVLGEISDAIIILLVVVLNAALGVFQEAKAEEAINALRQMASPMARVKRNGHVVSIKSEDIVPGDIVLLEAGDVVPADIRLIEANSLKVEEAALTGESVPVEKEMVIVEDDASLGDRVNMAFSSTNVTYGRGTGVVVGTGMNTEVGHIANMLANAEESKTPLQENQDQLGKSLTVLILAIAAIMFVVGMLNGRPWLEMLLTSISVAVAAIPEGLPAITTIILALGTQKMAKRNALVRKLPAVETLGGTEVICSDKTGTLTMNQMTVEKVYYNGQVHEVTEDIDLSLPVMKIMNFANDTEISGDGRLIGDPTETAMVQFGIDKGMNLKEELAKEPRIAEVPFESDRKLMSTIHKLADGRFLIATKGAPDELLKRCTTLDINGEAKQMTNADRDEILSTNTSLAVQALRVLAMAYKFVDEVPAEMTSEAVEKDLVYAGMIGMIDPERPEAADAIRVAKGAGIRTIMITGDHRDTAQAIASRLGIIEEGQNDAVLTGAELNTQSDEEFARNVEKYSVYARVSPEHKVRIVKAWQNHGKVVSMTGDGVNDAPSLKTADIGVGMGITGTEVSKGASDMVLADDNFQTIVVAVEEGRKVFSNIQKAVQFLLSANLGEVLTLFIATFLGWTILEPVHILWINLVTDTFPAIALGLENAEKDIMEHKPRGRSSNFFSNGVGGAIIYQGIIEGGITLLVYWWAISNPAAGHVGELAHMDAETMAFITLGMIQLFHAYNSKSVYKSIFQVGIFSNMTLVYATLLSAVLLLGVILIPGLNTFFGVSVLTGTQWAVSIGAAFMIVPIVELVKALQRATGKK